jgi:hypothetical protein
MKIALGLILILNVIGLSILDDFTNSSTNSDDIRARNQQDGSPRKK